jgi:hypothetical protein
MGNMEAVARVISRSEWLVLAMSLIAFVVAGAIAGVVYRALECAGRRPAAVASFLALYLLAVFVYVGVFEHQYVRTWTDLLQAIPGPHGAADAEMASYMAKTQISGLRDWPPEIRLFAYPAWLLVAIPFAFFVLHTVWLFRRRAAA